jgi:hypothetical protein
MSIHYFINIIVFTLFAEALSVLFDIAIWKCGFGSTWYFDQLEKHRNNKYMRMWIHIEHFIIALFVSVLFDKHGIIRFDTN